MAELAEPAAAVAKGGDRRPLATPETLMGRHFPGADVLGGEARTQPSLGSRAAIRRLGAVAGNRVVATMLRRLPSGDDVKGDGPPLAVQRKIGFELEVGSVLTTKKGLLGGRSRLKKTDEIIRGTNFKLEADEADGVAGAAINPAWTDWYSDMEFVTDAFPVDQAGFAALRQALTEIVQITNALRNHVGNHVAADALGVGTGKSSVYLKPTSVTFTGKPQATVGLRLLALDRLFSEIKSTAIANNAKTLIGGGLGPGFIGKADNAPAQGIASIAAAQAAANAVLTQFALLRGNVFSSPPVRGFFTQLVLYLVQGFNGSQGYGKLIAGSFMQRTDFAATFLQLPPVVRKLFKDHPQAFADLACRAASSIAVAPRAGWPVWANNGPVFSGGLYHNQAMYQHSPKYQTNVLPDLARDQWLIGITQGTDFLTASAYPALGNKRTRKAKKAEIESLGSYGGKMDVLPGLAPTNLPLVELRGLPEIMVGIFPQMAADLFQYVYLLNTGNVAGFPGGTLGLSDKERIDLANNTGDAAATLTTILQNAENTVNLWGGASGG